MKHVILFMHSAFSPNLNLMKELTEKLTEQFYCVTFKYGIGKSHQNWYEGVELTSVVIIMQRLTQCLNTVFENKTPIKLAFF